MIFGQPGRLEEAAARQARELAERLVNVTVLRGEPILLIGYSAISLSYSE